MANLVLVTPAFLIKKYGGRKVAEMCGVARVTPYQWKRRGKLSTTAVLKLSTDFPRLYKVEGNQLYRRIR
jgi:predicted site-specific integrase-resolvase